MEADKNIPTGKNKYLAKRGIDVENLDPTVSPKDNFYHYACGGWMRKHPLTAEYSRFGTFDLLRENAREQLKGLIMGLGELPEAKERGTIAQKVSTLYSMGMDVERLNREGAGPLKPLLKRVEESGMESLPETLAWLHGSICSSFFGTGVGPDPADSNRNIMHMGEVGLGLGDRDYYLEKSEENERILRAYEKYIKRIMTLAGYGEERAQRVWETVIELETEFARHKMTREERRNPLLRHNMRTIEEIEKEYPNIEWKRYFKALGVEGLTEVNVGSLKFMEFLNDYLPTLTREKVEDYLLFDIVSDSTGVLSEEFEEASFELYGKVMSGKEEQEPRWKRAMTIPNSMLGEAVGELYVAKYFPSESKSYMIELVEDLRKSLGKHIDKLEWMSVDTKGKAKEKLNEMKVKIGYPEKWKDYSEIDIDPEKSYLENVYNAAVWFTRDNYSKLGKPVDKTEWHMTPQTVNAYYSPVVNEICFPAAILQPPYFDPEADDALNYGAIGVVIGHEMTHGFDDQGRQFDKNGNLHNWWNEEDATRFNQLADKLVAQFDAVEVASGTHANGRYTLGENIADQGGLRLAMTAYSEKLERTGEEGFTIDGFTPAQRFYLSYANVWAGNIRPEEILVRTKTDPHSLGELRVNETLKNIGPFFEAFGIKEEDPMGRKESEQVIIW